MRIEDQDPIVRELIEAERRALAEGPQGGAQAVQTGGTRAERKLRAAYHDVESLDYAQSKNAEALAHHNEQAENLKAQRLFADATFAGALDAVKQERAKP